jgi:hypothetical protein
MPSRFTNYWFDTAGNTGANYGVTVIPANNVLCRVEVKTTLSFAAQETTYPNPGFIPSPFSGLQLLDNGSTLLNLPADLGDNRWLTVEAPAPAPYVVAWSPSTADVAVDIAGGLTAVWKGQVKMIVDMVLAFTTGSMGGTPPDWMLAGTMQYWLA